MHYNHKKIAANKSAAPACRRCGGLSTKALDKVARDLIGEHKSLDKFEMEVESASRVGEDNYIGLALAFGRAYAKADSGTIPKKIRHAMMMLVFWKAIADVEGN